jgi:hypothetical protein
MRKQNRIEEEEEYVHFAPMRFCRSDETGDFEQTGLYVTLYIFQCLTYCSYFPNYQIIYDKRTNQPKGIALHQPRPTFAHVRDVFHWYVSIQKLID